MEEDSKEQIKKELFSRIDELKKISEPGEYPPAQKPADQEEITKNDEFFKSPRWRDHLININKLWNIFTNEEKVRTGILHEINEGWSLQPLFDSESCKHLNEMVKEIRDTEQSKRGQLFKDAKKSDRKIVDILLGIHDEISDFTGLQKDFNAKLVRSINTFFELLNNTLNVQKTFNAETVRFINEYIGIEDPEGQNIFLQERKLLNDRLEAFLRVLERRFTSSELKIHREIKTLAEMMNNFFALSEHRWEGRLPSASQELSGPRKKIDNYEYAFFEDLWRGERHDIKTRQKRYLTYFKDRKNILDFGCGRGEFLEVLAEANIDSFGVEENEEMAGICREKQLNVICQNGVVYLHRISDNFLGGIFISHVIEHLSYEDIMKLINMCYRKLEQDGVMVLETINPTNLNAFLNHYIKDFTHKTPVHLDTLKFILKMNGFKIMEILELSEVHEDARLKKLDSDARGFDEETLNRYNMNIDRLNALLFGNQDYAVIACK